MEDVVFPYKDIANLKYYSHKESQPYQEPTIHGTLLSYQNLTLVSAGKTMGIVEREELKVKFFRRVYFVGDNGISVACYFVVEH